jgi:hypothetical protein
VPIPKAAWETELLALAASLPESELIVEPEAEAEAMQGRSQLAPVPEVPEVSESDLLYAFQE